MSTILASALPYLSMGLLSRVEMWLTYQDLKPVSSVEIKRPLREKSRSSKRIIDWLEKAGICYIEDDEDEFMLHISKQKHLAEKIKEIMREDTFESIVTKGELYGYPQEATMILARLLETGEDIINTPDLIRMDSEVLDAYYWEPYMRYRIRSNFAYEDSMIAKKWADCLRADVPILARWFENRLIGLRHG